MDVCVDSQANTSEILTALIELGQVDIPVRLLVTNPLSVDITIVGVDGYVTYNDTVYGEIPVGVTDFDIPTGPNITIPGNSTFLSPPVPIRMILTGTRPPPVYRCVAKLSSYLTRCYCLCDGSVCKKAWRSVAQATSAQHPACRWRQAS